MPTTPPNRRRTTGLVTTRGGGSLSPEREAMTLAKRAALRRFTLHYGQTLVWNAIHHEGYKVVGVFAGTGGGKALALDTPIPTPSGWTTMGDLHEGDVVLDECGRPCTVTYATPVQYDRRCYDVVFSDGAVITADADHRWLTATHAERKAARRRVTVPSPSHATRPQCAPRLRPQVRTTEEIRATLLHTIGEATRANHAVAVAEALDLPEAALPVDPYVLGVWLGDGNTREAVLTCDDPPILEEVAAAGYVVRKQQGPFMYGIGAAPTRRDPQTGRLTSTHGLHAALRTLGVLGDKHVPAVYLRGSVAQRLAILQGLMDTDGTADKDGGCSFDNTSERLAEAVYELVVSLGMQARRVTRQVRYLDRLTTVYRVVFTPSRPVFRLPRKLERLRISTGQGVRQTQAYRYIVAVRERPSVPVRCITVDSPSHLYLAGRAMVPTHNTWSGPRLLYPIIRKNLDKKYLFIEPTWRMVKRIMVPEVVPFLDAFGMGRMHLGDMVYELNGGGRIYFGSVDNPNSLQGVHIDGAVWADEVGLYSEEAWDVILQRRAAFQALVLATSTPYTLPWVERRIAKPASDPRDAATYRLIQFPSYYNPGYNVEEFFRLKRIWPKDKFERLMLGQFTRIGGLCFEEYNEEKHLATIYRYPTEDGSLAVWFKHPTEAPRGEVRPLVSTWMSQDWGWNPDPGCQFLFGEDAYGREYCLEEDYETFIPVERGTSSGADTWVNRARKRQQVWGADDIYCDPSSPADIESMRQWGLNAVKAINSHEYGFDRVNSQFHDLGGGLGVGLYIAQNACPNLVRTIGSYVRAKSPTSDGYLNKAAPNQEDHSEDAFRYGVVRDLEKGQAVHADPDPELLAARRKGV